MDELRCLTMDRLNHSRMAMAGIADSNPCIEIKKLIAINILHPNPLCLFNHKGIHTGVGLRYESLIPLENLSRLGPGKFCDNRRETYLTGIC
jgi:hypothetical protein